MAIRPAYFVKDNKIVEKNFEFTWFPRFSVSQKRKSIESLHSQIHAAYPSANPQEISTKGEIPLGTKLSAFNLHLDHIPLECVFQSSKVFNDTDKPHLEWRSLHPKEAKAATRALHEQGKILTGFFYDGESFPLLPKTAFYDYIYLQSVAESLTIEEIQDVMNYDFFTDIEFNPQRSINTQARTVALLRHILLQFGSLRSFSKDEFIAYHKEYIG